jgi:hypothetical protein
MVILTLIEREILCFGIRKNLVCCDRAVTIIRASVKCVKKKLGKFLSLYRHKNYRDPLRSLFVANF